MNCKCSSSVADRRTESDKMASVKRIAVVAAVVLLLSMAVVGAASAYTVTITTNSNTGISGTHSVSYMYSIDGGSTFIATSGAFDVVAGNYVFIKAICVNCTVRPQEWNIPNDVTFSSIEKDYCMVRFAMPSKDITIYVNEGKMLPVEYTEVEYIESEGKTGQDFLLGESVPAGGFIEVVFVPMEVNCTTGAGYCGIMGNNGSTQLAWNDSGWYTGQRGSSTPYPPTVGKKFVYKWDQTDGKYYIDGEYTNLSRKSLALNLFHSEDAAQKAKCYSVNVYSNATYSLANEYVPCVRNSDGTAGMYDTVTGNFYTTTGSNKLLYGFKANLVVTYNANGATSGNAPVDGMRYAGQKNATVMNQYDLEKTGKYFAGWTLDPEGTETVYVPGQSMMLTGDVTLYAKRIDAEPGYTVAYNSNIMVSGAAPVDTNQYSSYDEVTVKNGGTLVKTGYTFTGWTLSQDGSGDLYGPGTEHETYTMGTGSVVFYAKWTPNEYIITYKDQSGGTFSGDNFDELKTSHTYGTTTTLVAGDKEGYVFSGWYRDYNCKYYYIGLTLDGYAITGDTTLYCIWTQITYAVHFDANGGSGSMNDQTLTYGKAEYLYKNEFLNNNSAFSGWATEPGGDVVYTDGQAVANLTSTGGATVNLYAVWNSITYTVTIPAFINLDSSGMATSAKYSVIMKSSAIADNLGVITMKLTGSENYAEDPAGFKVKSIGSDEYLRYTIKKNGDTVRLDDEVVSVNVNGSGGISSTETMSYQLSDFAAYAGVYQDILTFTMSVTDVISLQLVGGIWTETGNAVTPITVSTIDVPVGAEISVNGNTVTFSKDGYNTVEVTHSSSNTDLLIGNSGSKRECKTGDTVLDSDRKMVCGVPAEYTEVEYIEGTGTQYIAFGKIMYSGDGGYIEVDFAPMELNCSTGSGYCGIMGHNGYTQLGWYKTGWTTGNSNSSPSIKPAIGTKYTYIWDADTGKYYIDSTDVGLTRTGSLTLDLFYTANSAHKAKCYSVRVYNKQGYLVNEYIPCIRNTDSVVGMYDIVNGKFYVNAGSGVFYPGPVVNPDSGAILVTGITLNKSSTTISVSGTDELTAIITTASNPTYPYVTWSSSDTSKATVDCSGKVTGVAVTEDEQPVTITATAIDGSGVTATCEVTVIAAAS